MQLSSKDVEEFYYDLKNGAFFLETKKDIINSFESHTQWNVLSPKNNAQKIEDAVLHAVSMEYFDAIELINVCMPARIYIVVAIASFLTSMNCSIKIVPNEIRRDLLDILAHDRIREYKRYFSYEDYAAMIQEENMISKWFNEQ